MDPSCLQLINNIIIKLFKLVTTEECTGKTSKVQTLELFYLFAQNVKFCMQPSFNRKALH